MTLLFVQACKNKGEPKAIDLLIQEEVEAKIKRYRAIRTRNCYEKVLEEANQIVDSILIVQARLERDTASKPPIPDKPEKPELITLEDTIPVAPFLEEEQDSSLIN